VAASGKRKAALLLAGLDSATAAELLKSADPEKLAEIAAELAYLRAEGRASEQAASEPLREFSALLRKGAARGKQRFLEQMLDNAVGKDKSPEVLARVRSLLDARDPFLPIRAAAAEDIAKALEGEPAQVASIVLADLPASKSAKLLPLLPDKVRPQAVRSMASGEEVSLETRLRVAAVVRNRLEQFTDKGESAAGPDRRQQQLRKVAVLLRGLSQELRADLLESVSNADQAGAEEIQKLMVIWEDLHVVTERSLQEGLRRLEPKQLALALTGADEATVSRIRGNISERANALLDEEVGLISSSKPEEVQEAREAIVGALREMDQNGELNFEEAQA